MRTYTVYHQSDGKKAISRCCVKIDGKVYKFALMDKREWHKDKKLCKGLTIKACQNGLKVLRNVGKKALDDNDEIKDKYKDIKYRRGNDFPIIYRYKTSH